MFVFNLLLVPVLTISTWTRNRELRDLNARLVPRRAAPPPDPDAPPTRRTHAMDDASRRDARIRPGDGVVGCDGQRVGMVVALTPSHVVVEKGYLAPTRYRVPNGAVAGYDDGEVALTVTKTAVLSRGWDVPRP